MPDTSDYSIQELAEKMGVDYKTVRRLIDKDELDAYYVGRIIRITEEAFQAFKQQSAVPPSMREPIKRTTYQKRYTPTTNYVYTPGDRPAKAMLERMRAEGQLGKVK